MVISTATRQNIGQAPIEVLRIGVHPPDVHHPALLHSIGKTFATAAKRRRLARYSDLLANDRTGIAAQTSRIS